MAKKGRRLRPSFVYSFYHKCIKCCIINVTTVIPIQQAIPIKIGFPPLFTNFTTFVLNPIAPIAITMKNLDNSFNGWNVSAGIPAAVATVVIILAPMKKSIKNGNTLRIDTFSPLCSSAFLARYSASPKVIGMIASVLVNFTVTALSNV